MKIIICLLLTAGQAFAQVKPVINPEQLKPFSVGVIRRDYVDSSRSNWLGTGFRPVRSVIWYPAEQGTVVENTTDTSQVLIPSNISNGPDISRVRDKYALVILSHGSMGNAEQMSWLGVYLASRGYISVAVNHNGTDIEERKTGLLTLSDACMWERPKDISAVIDKMLKDPDFSSKVDTNRIACAGFSLGGATAIWVVGAIFNIDSLSKGEPAPPPFLKESIDRFIELKKTDPVIINSFKHCGDSFRDKRIKAVFALAPAIGQGFTKEGLKDITIPVQIVVGDADVVAPMSLNAAHYAGNIPSARPLIILPGERGHYLKPSAGNEHDVELREVARLAYNFFGEVLR